MPPPFRIGVTGRRRVNARELPRLGAQLSAILAAIVHHAPAPDLLSPLAEGADRLVAEIALAHGARLICPLPFARAEYEKDFATPDSLAAFRSLLARAEGRVIELPGGRGDAETSSYAAVGEYVARNADLLIALWDGAPGQGPGGTADTVRFAACHGTPTICLDPRIPAAPRWIEGPAALSPTAPPDPIDDRLAMVLSRSH